MTNFLYCDNPLENNKVDFDYEEEFNASKRKGNNCGLFSYEEMAEGRLKLRGDKIENLTIYRGWMMKPEMYMAFYEKLLEEGVSLINTPEEYEKYHLLPNWYNDFKEITAKSSWTEDLSDESIKKLLKDFTGAVIVKDYVKSRKHEWEEACFIPDVTDVDNAMKVIKTFIKRQDDSLVGGIVLREFLDLKTIGYHKISGMPISEEYRVFVLNNKPLIMDSYWNELESNLSLDEENWILEIAEKLESKFVTIDFARKTDGSIVIMELGDGQVSGLQEIKEEQFYKKINAYK